MSTARARILALALPLVFLAACASSGPPAPAWQLQASGALARFQQAWLTGADRVATAEFRRAREALAGTGDATQVARAELTRCALQVSALQPEPCTGFEALRADVAPPERAYAEYILGQPLTPQQVVLLPPQHRAVAAAARPDVDLLRAIEDPLARLVAAGVLLRGGRASPPMLQLAVDTAAERGWRRPLLAWLGLQALQAERAGNHEEAQRLRRRMDLAGRPAPE